MKSVVGFYREVGRGTKAFMNKKSQPFLKGTHPPIWQTPGKLQYYRAEMEPYVPDEIKWQIRMPTRYAMRELKRPYLDQIHEETTNFLNERIKYDFLRPGKELTLDLTIREAEILMSANEEVRELAAKGELQKLHTNFNTLQDRVEAEYLQTRDHVQKILHQIQEKENDLYRQIGEMGITKIVPQGFTTIFDQFSLTRTDPTIINIQRIEKAISKGHAQSEQLQQIVEKLKAYVGIKEKYFELKVLMREDYVRKVAKNDPALKSELENMASLKNHFIEYFSQNQVKNEEYTTYTNALNSLANDQVKNVMNLFSEYEKAYNERERFYHHFTRGQESEALQTFKQDLLHHLAGSIVVKEHRWRYQQEQFDRFMRSMQYRPLFKNNATLREFALEYALLIEDSIEDSHNNRSPKIEANYDDFAEKTVRPLNATIFYYFFSADKRRKTVAQWLLSAVRYPNDRVRRAYMRFFA